VQRRFQTLLDRITLGLIEQSIFLRHRQTVTARLNQAFGVHQVLPFGSHVRRTAIAKHSDLDLMLVLRVAEVQWGGQWNLSTTVLNQVREQLQDRYQRTVVVRDELAIVIDFADGQHPVEVVPAVFTGLNNGSPIYCIPDGAGGWMETSPRAHNKFILEADTRSLGKLKNVAKLLKYWRVCRTPTIPLNAFHLELRLAEEGLCAGVKTYGHCLHDAFRALNAHDCGALRDPRGISGLIPAADTDAKRERLQAAIAASMSHARTGLLAEQDGDGATAIQQWNLVFNGHFPQR
jgi:predicted nucleotidyltransferase